MGRARIFRCMMMKSVVKRLYLNARMAVLRVAGFFVLRETTRPGSEPLRRILFIRIDRIGDLVLSTPALRAVKEAYPDSELTVLASPSNAPVIFHNPCVDRTIVFNAGGGLREGLRTIRRLRGCAFDAAVDPYNNYALKTAVLSFLSGAAFRIGYDSFGRGIFYHRALEEGTTPRHLVDIALDALRPLGIEASNRRPELFLSDEEKQQARDWLNARGLGSRPVIGLHPGAFYPSQRWPLEYFSEVIHKIQNRGDHDIILFGGPGDGFIVRDIASRLRREPPILMGGGLRRFAAVLSRCDRLICNNSGPLHVAAALGIPTLSFMGPTVKETWEPIGDIHRVLRRNELPCIGCNQGSCRIRTHDCMRLILPDTVMENILPMDRSRGPNAKAGLVQNEK